MREASYSGESGVLSCGILCSSFDYSMIKPGLFFLGLIVLLLLVFFGVKTSAPSLDMVALPDESGFCCLEQIGCLAQSNPASCKSEGGIAFAASESVCQLVCGFPTATHAAPPDNQ